jgi:hypothetical protein
MSLFSYVLYRPFILRSERLRMITYIFLIIYTAAPIKILLVALAVCTIRTVEIGSIAAFFLKTRVLTAR